METLKQCPICENEHNKVFLRCTDYTVSRETFTIVSCDQCGFKFTNPRPEAGSLGKYYLSEDYVSHSNASKGIVNFLYQKVRVYTLKKKLNLINRLSAKGRLLDIGCGTGEFLQTCRTGGWDVIGIEPSEQARKQAIGSFGLDIKTEEELNNLNKESFNVISLWHVLEHVPALNERIEEIKQLLKPEGKIIIAVPNCSSEDAAHYGEYWAAYDVPRHLYHFSPKDIGRLAEKHGLRVIETLPMLFDSYYVSMLSEKYKTGHRGLFRALIRGVISNRKAAKNNLTYSSQIYILGK
ncbi:MAG: class I SAM-dependent methyltransferase [Bacteroidia bacterium]